jgi:hypothetical protein
VEEGKTEFEVEKVRRSEWMPILNSGGKVLELFRVRRGVKDKLSPALNLIKK